MIALQNLIAKHLEKHKIVSLGHPKQRYNVSPGKPHIVPVREIDGSDQLRT